MGESSDASCSVFIIAEDGIYEFTLQQEPVYTCVNILLKETSGSLLEAVCNALNVSKANVCAIAGDIKADEGKFSKSILYYKLAGVSKNLILSFSKGHSFLHCTMQITYGRTKSISI